MAKIASDSRFGEWINQTIKKIVSRKLRKLTLRHLVTLAQQSKLGPRAFELQISDNRLSKPRISPVLNREEPSNATTHDVMTISVV
ncbi:hypothetical protein WN51_11566 [Melipona quadrifasciata]|uniref:Uncharacterized protein n=1 Tax=Melipona quadrifasciata TaxID=166423 RepID=A0A0M9A336_9HYME|nr:hypothetical protein WN51_11566 [Melipona quadrifasciata]